MTKLRVLHVVNDANTGGAQALIEQLCQQWHGDVEVHLVVLLGEGVLSDRYERVSKSVTYLGMSRKQVTIGRAMKRLQGVIRRTRPHLLHSHLLQADVLVALANIKGALPHVSTVHTSGFSTRDPLRTRMISRLVARVLSRRFAKIVACGAASAAYMAAAGYPQRTSLVIQNGVPISSDHEPSWDERETVLLHLARNHPMKDHVTLFQALRLARDAGANIRLRCAGSGVDASDEGLLGTLRALDLQDDVELLGALSDVEPLWASAHFLILSSSYGEALPMAGLEALAHGVPVLTTDVGDCYKLATRKEYCVPARNPEALASVMISWRSLDEETYRVQSRESHSLAAREYSIEATAQAYLRLYRELIRSALVTSRTIQSGECK